MADQRDGGIAWTDTTWNCVRGCSRVSLGCRHCYAEGVAARFSGPGLTYEGLALRKPSGPAWTGEVRFVSEHLGDPLGWKRPRRIFVNSMSDLFHEKVADEHIAAVFGVMAAAPQHTFQCLTKRPQRMLEWFKWVESSPVSAHPFGAARGVRWYAWTLASQLGLKWESTVAPSYSAANKPDWRWPLPNVHVGVSAENQATADERIPLLLQTPAAVRFVSAEPLLGPIDFTRHLKPSLITRDGRRLQNPDPEAATTGGTWEWGVDWIIAGGESGPGARECEIGWVLGIVNQCRSANKPCFVKQLGSRPRMNGHDDISWWKGGHTHPDGFPRFADRKGGDMDEWPEVLRVRQFPEVSR